MASVITPKELPGLEPKTATEVQRLFDYIRELAEGIERIQSQLHSLGGGAPVTRREVETLLAGLVPPLIGGSQDPQLAEVGTGTGTLSSVTVTAGSNLTGGGTATSGSSTVTLVVSANPSFSSVTVNTSKWRGYTTSVLDPSTTEYPNDRDWGIHKNSGTGLIYLAFNHGGAIVKVQLV